VCAEVLAADIKKADQGEKIIDFSPLYRLMADIVFWITIFLVVLVDTFVIRLKVVGRENLFKVSNGGCFLISNHTLYLDPGIIAHSILPHRTYFSALEATFRVRYLGNYIRYLGAFPIPEELGVKKIFKSVQMALDRGWWIHFFPERDLRHCNQEISAFHGGVFYLAVRFNRPVIPVTIVLKPLRLGKYISCRRLFRVKAVIGEPIYPHTFNGNGTKMRQVIDNMSQQAHRMMMNSIRQYGEAVQEPLLFFP
jgi:1-acyl-sn-glycerol-3-phosphate acyltransferase